MSLSEPTSDFQDAPELSVEVAIVGGGPAGLMAAEVLSQAGVSVHLFDAMPSVGRKFLLAGRGGLNLTHSEPLALFTTRYGPREPEVSQWLSGLDAQGVRDWAQSLGVSTFVGHIGASVPGRNESRPFAAGLVTALAPPRQGCACAVPHAPPLAGLAR